MSKLKYTHIDWKHFKKAFGLKNKDIAEMIGMEETSVGTQTAPNKELPKWAKLAIFAYKTEPKPIKQRKANVKKC